MNAELKWWSWILPGLGVGLLFALILLLGNGAGEASRYCAGGLVVMMFVLVVQTISGYRAFYREIHVDQLERMRRAESITPLSTRLESARGVAPEVVKLFMAEQNRVWALRHGNQAAGMVPHSVLYHAPNVTDIFVKYFLESSSDVAVMPKRVLVEGRKNRFDPWGAVDEYRMYDEFVGLLASQGRIIRYGESDAYVWAPPWTRKMVAEDFALEWEEG